MHNFDDKADNYLGSFKYRLYQCWCKHSRHLNLTEQGICLASPDPEQFSVYKRDKGGVERGFALFRKFECL